MGDPLEGVGSDGTIVTGADRSRIAPSWQPVLADVRRTVLDRAPGASVFVFGSVATGQAVPARSDVDLLVIGLSSTAAAEVTRTLSARYADLTRAVEVGAASSSDFVGDRDEAYGNRVFLRHYCVHLAGPTTLVPTHDYPADRSAARGFNGDIGRHHARWRAALDSGDDPGELARRIARKSLLALAGLVSIHDDKWTTDRVRAVDRWSVIEPVRADGLTTLSSWIDDRPEVDRSTLAATLDNTIEPIVQRFATDIGLWS